MADRTGDRHRLTVAHHVQCELRAATKRVAAMLCALLIALCAAVPAATAQESWVYSPYRVRVWMAIEKRPPVTEQLIESIQKALVQQAWVVAGATWQVQPQAAPDALAFDILHDQESLNDERILTADASLGEDDKLMLLGIRVDGAQFVVQAREWDSRTRQWGHVIRRDVAQRELVPGEAFRAVADAFAPIARIEDVREGKAYMRVRASGLVVDAFCPAAVTTGSVLRPVVRQNDRYGNPRPNGVRPIEWTLLHVSSVEGAMAAGDIHSINRGYLSGRSSSRLERYAIGVRTNGNATEIELISRDTAKRPLVGYDIYSKNPGTDESVLLGETDWRGRLTVTQPDDGTFRVLYVYSGAMPLARLPLVPGQAELATAELVDDEKRLQAEALVRSMQGSLVEIVAQRELLAARTRQHIQQGNYAEAQRLIDQFRSLPTLSELRDRLDRAKQEVASENIRIQSRIDQMFVETQESLLKYIDPRLGDNLAGELANAQRAQ